ncbi:MAG: hydantoinase/oxoprolinase family protein [Actinomycetia bacterium]|nr:hydantoinase/oxoprolinase family protein [Actinomycetes bacterium]
MTSQTKDHDPLARRVLVGIDTGGTFTDVITFDPTSGQVFATKTPSTPHDPSQGFLTGVDQGLSEAELETADLKSVCHGTTVATNALLQDEVAGLGFLTTHGFRHVLEIARQSVPEGYGNSYFWVKPERIVPLGLIREASGRLDATGSEVEPLDEEAVAEAAAFFARSGVDAVGICFLHSYVSDAHEHRAREIFTEIHPQCSVSISSDVLREYREYERSMTTLVDAFVKRSVVDYVRSIEARLGELCEVDSVDGVGFYIMKSNGGVASAAGVESRPISTVLSGPAAGALGAAHLARAAGFDNVLALDGGGTSTDVTVVRHATPALTTEGTIGRFPTKVPMIDIVTVGTGGGSIAWSPPEGGLKVGPRSAGADPGPLCYSKGGTEPTHTDAQLVLGRIPPHLLGGRIPLDVSAAETGIGSLAATIGMSTQACAEGVLEIAVWNQANAIRQVSVKRGLDVRDFALCCFGGSGSLGACRLLDILRLEAVIVPPNPGNVSAFGLLTVDVRNDEVQTFVVRDDKVDLTQLSSGFAALEERLRLTLDAEGFPRDSQRIELSADLRYDGQAYEVQATCPPGPIDQAFRQSVLDSFHDAHEAQYGYCYRQDPSQVIEWVNLRVSGTGPIDGPSLRELDTAEGEPQASGTRHVTFGGEAIETPTFARDGLGAGQRINGPAIIEEFGSTVPLAPGFFAVVDRLGNLIIRMENR